MKTSIEISTAQDRLFYYYEGVFQEKIYTKEQMKQIKEIAYLLEKDRQCNNIL